MGTPSETFARMPVLFVGHGSPLNAIEDNEFSRAWVEMGATLPRPRAILCISAHWETRGVAVTAMEQPRTIHDFYGFPRPLYEKKYPAPGSPQVARLIQQTVRKTVVQLDTGWGLDHGAWSVLCRMFPKADIPVLQLSLDTSQPPAFHYELGRELRVLRQQGILIINSGNIVHNLRAVIWEDTAFGWAQEFDGKIKHWIETGDHENILHYDQLGEAARMAVPTSEHFLPLLYTLAAQEPGEAVQFFADRVTYGSISMRSLKIG